MLECSHEIVAGDKKLSVNSIIYFCGSTTEMTAINCNYIILL